MRSALRAGALPAALLAMLCLLRASALAIAADVPLKPSPAVVSVEILGKTNRLGSGVVVSDEGLIVTSFALASSGPRAQVTFADGTKHDVAGFVAARKGKDLVILSLRKKVRNVAFLPLSREATEPGTPVLLQCGPRSAPFLMATTTIGSVRTGDVLQSGRKPAEGSPLDPDGCWILADSFVPETGIGGAMIDGEGNLLGMMSPDAGHSDRSHAAIHADHIARLLVSVDPRSKPLSALKNYDDAAPESVPAEDPQPLVVPGTVDRGGTIADWIAGLRARLSATERELPTFRDNEDSIRVAVKEQLTREQELIRNHMAIEQEARSIRPEVPIRRRKLVTYETLDETGKPVIKREVVNAIDYEYSPRQQKQLANLKAQADEAASQVERVRIEIRLNEFRIEQVALDRAAAEQRVAALWDELFLLADPLEIRQADDAKAALAELTKITDTFGTTGRVLLVKAMLHLRQRQFDECLQAADQADDLDKSLGLVVEALRARCAFLKGDAADAARQVAKLGRGAGEDPRVLLLLARYELDRENFVPALRQVKQAVEKGLDPTESNVLLGLMYATAPHKSSGDVPRALEHAGRACAGTLWKDWRGLVALSAAQAAAKNFDGALETLNRAEQTAPAHYAGDIARWRGNLEAKEPLTFAWN